MIVTKTVQLNGRLFTVSTSDSGYMIERDGELYYEAWDPEGTGRTYTESDTLIPTDDNEATDADYQAALEEMGVKFND